MSDKNFSIRYIKAPSKYGVVIYGDEFTPSEYTYLLLKQEFSISNKEALELISQLNNFGKCKVGRYSKEIAETKCHNCNVISRVMSYPLLCGIEKRE